MALHRHGECLSSRLRSATPKTRHFPHAFKGRRLSVQAAQADVSVKQKRSELFLPSSVTLKPLSSCFIHAITRLTDLPASVSDTCCSAEQAASEDAVLVVGAGIAGLATAAALHKVRAYPGAWRMRQY